MHNYVSKIWAARYFWTHLALADLRSRWRRSFLGIFWTMLQPLGLTALISFVFSKMFHNDILSYAPYILSGIIVWEFITAALAGGSLSFVQADAYIKQCRHPLAIYTLRTVVAALVVLLLASVPLLVWTLAVMPGNLNWSWLALVSFYPILALIAWPLCTLLAYIGARFRDVPHVMGLVLQGLWFMSPVYFEESMFRRGGLDVLVDFNPIYHLFQILRAPLLHGEWPTAENYIFSLATAAIFGLLAIAMGWRAEKKVIFYL